MWVEQIERQVMRFVRLQPSLIVFRFDDDTHPVVILRHPLVRLDGHRPPYRGIGLRQVCRELSFPENQGAFPAEALVTDPHLYVAGSLIARFPRGGIALILAPRIKVQTRYRARRSQYSASGPRSRDTGSSGPFSEGTCSQVMRISRW